jgi:mycothiol synthase
VTGWEQSVAGLRHMEKRWQGAHLLATLAGELAGTATLFVFPGTETAAHASADVCVLQKLRRRGIGSQLLRALSAEAEQIGRSGLQLEVREDDPDSLAFVEHRRFVDVERQQGLVLELKELEPLPAGPPEGVEIVVQAERPDLERALYDMSREAVRDIPGLDSTYVQTFEQWRSFEIERPTRAHGLCFVAVHRDEVVGYASMTASAATGFHGLTAVARAWRRRGVATALKRAQIAAAKYAGLERLVTESEARNMPMLRLNEKLGYEPVPALIVFRGPLYGR